MTTIPTPGTRVRINRSGLTGTVVPNSERPNTPGEIVLIRPDDPSDLPQETADGLWSISANDPGLVVLPSLPPGTRVALDAGLFIPHRTGVVVHLTEATVQHWVNVADCTPVRLPDGTVQWWNTNRITALAPLATPTEYPVGCLVRDTKYDTLARVIETRPHGAVRVRWFDGSTGTFPSPEERLERLYPLTRAELGRIEAGLHTGVPSDEQDASDILDKHLRPNRTTVFTVTVTQPADAPKQVDAWYIEHMLKSDDQTGFAVEIKENN